MASFPGTRWIHRIADRWETARTRTNFVSDVILANVGLAIVMGIGNLVVDLDCFEGVHDGPWIVSTVGPPWLHTAINGTVNLAVVLSLTQLIPVWGRWRTVLARFGVFNLAVVWPFAVAAGLAWIATVRNNGGQCILGRWI